MASLQGLYKSTDRGAVLAQVQPGGTGCVAMGALVVAATSPAPLMAAGWLYSSCALDAMAECTLFKSLDGGESWDCLGVDAASIAMAPSAPSTLYAVGYDQGTGTPILASTDLGATWQVANAGVLRSVPDYPCDPFLVVHPAP